MKLITQNFMRCQAKDCADDTIHHEDNKGPYPLRIIVETSEEEKIDDDYYSFIAKIKMIQNIEYPALLASIKDIEFKADMENQAYTEEEIDLPKTLPEEWEKDEEFVNRVFNLVMTKEIITGQLVCRKCDREFGIVNGIINMLLKEDEIDQNE
mmetsp:Transcript_16776/g.14709  ORF Transcript_16776/g.14709 Transcript_16776/m.14709 type:complete len:153 (+) Transcript_16776:33-491(+)